MKKLILFAGVCALAACSEAEAPPAEEEAVAEAEAPTGPQPGTYEVTEADGSSYSITIGDGNTWNASNADGEEASGTFEVVDGKACFTTEGSEDPPRCSTASAPDENDVVTVTYDDGSTATVTRAEEAPAAE